MGLNAEVRNFFTGRINKVLSKKRDEVLRAIDKKKVKDEVLARFGSQYEARELIHYWQKFVEDKKALDARQSDLEHATRSLLGKINPGYYGYSTPSFETLAGKASELFKDEVEAELYPDVKSQLEKLDKIQEDVQGVVLLATTEPKLVSALTKVLENYGGEIKELLELLPKE